MFSSLLPELKPTRARAHTHKTFVRTLCILKKLALLSSNRKCLSPVCWRTEGGVWRKRGEQYYQAHPTHTQKPKALTCCKWVLWRWDHTSVEFLENSKIELGEPRGWEATLSQMPRGVSLVPEVSFRNPADFLPHSSSRRAHPSPAEQVRDGVEVANWIHQLEATHCGGGWNGGPPGSQAERKGSKVVSPQEGDSRAGPLGEGCWQVMVGVLQTEEDSAP